MKITTQKEIWRNQIIEQEYEARVQIKKGQIITVIVSAEDGCIMSWKAKGKSDIIIVSKLSAIQKQDLDELIDEMKVDE